MQRKERRIWWAVPKRRELSRLCGIYQKDREDQKANQRDFSSQATVDRLKRRWGFQEVEWELLKEKGFQVHLWIQSEGFQRASRVQRSAAAKPSEPQQFYSLDHQVFMIYRKEQFVFSILIVGQKLHFLSFKSRHGLSPGLKQTAEFLLLITWTPSLIFQWLVWLFHVRLILFNFYIYPFALFLAVVFNFFFSLWL